MTDKVWHELAFGLENMNVPQNIIARRVAEMASYFGIEAWFEKNVSELSGGQKQLLNLAAVMVMQPEILILDEPTAQLDPIAASDFIATLKKLNRDLSLTIIITEHRLEDIIPICDKLMVLDSGTMIDYAPARDVIESLKNHPKLLKAMPSASRLYHAAGGSGICPLDAREGRSFIESTFDNRIRSLPESEYAHSNVPALQLSDVFFRYDREAPDILHGLNLTVYENEIFCILGGKVQNCIFNILRVFNDSGVTGNFFLHFGGHHPDEFLSGSVPVFLRPVFREILSGEVGVDYFCPDFVFEGRLKSDFPKEIRNFLISIPQNAAKSVHQLP